MLWLQAVVVDSEVYLLKCRLLKVQFGYLYHLLKVVSHYSFLSSLYIKNIPDHQKSDANLSIDVT